jgi:hypothetical protein
MSGRASAPGRAKVAEQLRGLIEGRHTREEVASWAQRWVAIDDLDVPDQATWSVLRSMCGADLISTDRPFLYEVEDFTSWLRELGPTPVMGGAES